MQLNVVPENFLCRSDDTMKEELPYPVTEVTNIKLEIKQERVEGDAGFVSGCEDDDSSSDPAHSDDSGLPPVKRARPDPSERLQPPPPIVTLDNFRPWNEQTEPLELVKKARSSDIKFETPQIPPHGRLKRKPHRVPPISFAIRESPSLPIQSFVTRNPSILTLPSVTLEPSRVPSHPAVTYEPLSPQPSVSNDSISTRREQRNYKNMTRERRIEANARERTRVHTISAAFESLRRSVPSYSQGQKLSKLSVLRVACAYIAALGADLEGDHVDKVTDTIHTEGKLRKRKDELD